ncbi:hypothetical protein ACP4OV_015955 [Aristida adscensionis]
MAASGGALVAAAQGGLGSGWPSAVKDEGEGEECAGLEPFFYDEAAAVAEHAAALEKRRHKEQAIARYKERLLRAAQARDRIYQYDPKLGFKWYTRFHMVDLATFDLDEESPYGPMRYTDTYFEKATGKYGSIYREPGISEKWHAPGNSANIHSVRIAASDVGFPINVYGTVIARAKPDYKCVYLFNRDEDHCQLISSADDQLILTGPKRGLALVDAIYFEMDLKIKGDQGQKYKEFSKGFIDLDGRNLREKMSVQSKPLDSFLSTVEVMCAVVKRAVEATFTTEVIQGEFYGKILAHTTSIPNSLVLFDNKLAAGGSNGIIQLMRPVVAVCVDEMLTVKVVFGTGGSESERVIEFTPAVNGRDNAEVTCGSCKMLVKVAWSLISSSR